MKEKDTHTRQINLFRNKFSNQLNLDHELIKLSEIIP